MAETSMLWGAGGGGDESPHSESLTAALFSALVGVGGANEGVLARVLNGLAPSSIAGGTQVRVASGWAVVDGHPYRNDANKDITPVTPSAGTTGRRVVLRCSWAAQTVRLVEISNTDGTSAIPSLEQTSGTTYEIPICSYTVTTGGAIASFSDERGFATPATLDQLIRQSFASGARYLVALFGGGIGVASTGVAGIGMVATAANSGSVSAQDDGRTGLFLSAASAQARITTGTGNISANRSPRIDVRATPQRGDANLAQWQIGFSSSFTSGGNGAFFRRQTTGNVFAVTNQGTATTTDLGAFDDTTVRKWSVYTEDDGVTWKFAIDDVVVATHSTQVPTATTELEGGVGAWASGSGSVSADRCEVERIAITAKPAA